MSEAAVHAAELVVELETIREALGGAIALTAGLDQVDQARNLKPQPAYSGLRTRAEHALGIVDRVLEYLRTQAHTTGPAGSRDGEPV
jgi:hypothetical protein